MANKIVGKYFTHTDFAPREREVMSEVVALTGFDVQEELFRGTIYDDNKVGSIVYRGVWNNKPAVLKLQGLKPEVSEADMLNGFSKQNTSRLVRVPELYLDQPWSDTRGYGYLITEFVDAPKIFEMPFATDHEMQDFVRFYQSYRTESLTQPWIHRPSNIAPLAYVRSRVSHWHKISEQKGRLTFDDHRPYLNQFNELAAIHAPRINVVFAHGHLSANDILRERDGYVLLSNLFWSYRPEWYDLGVNIWACVMAIDDLQLTEKDVLAYVEKWLEVYQTIPVVRQDPDFERKMNFLLLERFIGAILVDLGAHDSFGKPENRARFEHLLRIHQGLFHEFAGRLI